MGAVSRVRDPHVAHLAGGWRDGVCRRRRQRSVRLTRDTQSTERTTRVCQCRVASCHNGCQRSGGSAKAARALPCRVLRRCRFSSPHAAQKPMDVNLLKRATAESDDPTPGYLYNEIASKWCARAAAQPWVRLCCRGGTWVGAGVGSAAGCLGRRRASSFTSGGVRVCRNHPVGSACHGEACGVSGEADGITEPQREGEDAVGGEGEQWRLARGGCLVRPRLAADARRPALRRRVVGR